MSFEIDKFQDSESQKIYTGISLSISFTLSPMSGFIEGLTFFHNTIGGSTVVERIFFALLLLDTYAGPAKISPCDVHQ